MSAAILGIGLCGSQASFGQCEVTQTQKRTASDAAVGDEYGGSVSIDGATAVVGASQENENGDSAGAAYVLIRATDSWAELAKLTADDGAAGDLFGVSVSVDGNYAIVGANLDDDNGAGSGSAYVFFNNAGTWGQQAKLMPDDGAMLDTFGNDVAISGDTVVVGAPLENENGFGAGAAYVFVRDGVNWTQQAKLTANDGAANDLLGSKVAIDGDRVLVSAGGHRGVGAAYVFLRTGNAWAQESKLTPGDGAAGDLYGSRVAIEGDLALVGSINDDDNGMDSGSVYGYDRSGGAWAFLNKLDPADGAAGDSFGDSISITGVTAVIGAPLDDDGGADSGSAYLFVFDGTNWEERAKLTASDAAVGDEFGMNVAIDGEFTVVGAPLDDGLSGSTHFFGRGCPDAPEVAAWNGIANLQGSNNCYNYSTNRQSNTFAQPGDEGGSPYTAFTCANMLAAAEADGLCMVSDPDDCPAGFCVVALVIDPNPCGDFHWYRLNDDGIWSHKPGGGTARDFDSATAAIVNPQTAKRTRKKQALLGGAIIEYVSAGYTDFCGYLCVPGDVPLGEPPPPFQGDPPVDGLLVTLEFHSGQDQPDWQVLDPARIAEIQAMIDAGTPTGAPPDDGLLGYDGFTLVGGVNVPSFPDQVRVASGFIEIVNNGEVEYRTDIAGLEVSLAIEAVDEQGLGELFSHCNGDLDENGIVAINDLLTLLATWGPCVACVADINIDDVVNVVDLLQLLAAWGPCP